MRRIPKGRSEVEKALDDDVRNAQALGISYGKYKALCLARGDASCNHAKKPKSKRRQRVSSRKFTDAQAFALWQAGLFDSKIGKSLGVSKIAVIAWRQKNDLPSQTDIKAGLARHSDYILIVDTSGEITIMRRPE